MFGIALTLTTVGVNAYAVPALSRSFLEGKTESIRILDSVFAGPLGTVSTLAFLLYSVGFVLFGVAVWRSGALPRWAGVLVAVHAPLVSGPFTVVGSFVGAVLALVGGGWIALSALREPSSGRAQGAQGARSRTAWPCSRSAGTDTWSCTTSQRPSIRRKHAVQRNHRSVM